MKNTKIICTIGPSSNTEKLITEMVKNGMNVARLNFSHGTYDEHSKYVAIIRKVSAKLHNPIAILQDLQGPKIRIAKLSRPIKLKEKARVVLGQDFTFDTDVWRFLRVGHRVLIEDGTIELVIREKKSQARFVVEAINNGLIQSHKGVNLPDSGITLPSLTDKDMKDLKFGMSLGMDYIAMSFAKEAKDIDRLKRQINKVYQGSGKKPLVIAKIERPEAVKHIKSIARVADGVMIARGDLAVEVDQTMVPIIKKEIIEVCMRDAKPVIVATQMLDSMTRNPRPTRAEIEDVADAVIDGTDAVMLSGESAFGKFPVETVKVMNKTILSTEKSRFAGDHCLYDGSDERGLAKLATDVCDKTSEGGVRYVILACDDMRLLAFLSHTRPSVPIIYTTGFISNYEQSALYWGVHGMLMDSQEPVNGALTILKKEKKIKPRDKVIIVAKQGREYTTTIYEVGN